jgi:hypothetical protein
MNVVEDEDPAFRTPRLFLRAGAGAQAPEVISWELRYGGLPIAAGSLRRDQEASFTEVASVDPAMDSSGLSLVARDEDGRPTAVEVICVRPVRRPTSVEAAARTRWKNVRDQPEAPALGQRLVAERQEVRPGGQSVCVYLAPPALLARRRWWLRNRRKNRRE